MARPCYLGRRTDGRYFVQIRMGKRAEEVFGRALLRVSLRTADGKKARRRLVDCLEWAMEVVEAPDLAALGSALDSRLAKYTSQGCPDSERPLSERLGFEHQVRQFMVRANERQYPYARDFPGFASSWVTFVDQNKVAEKAIAAEIEQRAYQAGRDAAGAEFVQMPAGSLLPAAPSNAIDPMAMIKSLVKDEISKLLAAQLAPPPLPIAPGAPVAEPSAESKVRLTVPQQSSQTGRMSEALAEFMRPVDRKHARNVKGRSEAAPVIQFAVDFLGNPAFNDVTPEDWKRVDEALTDIPAPKNIPQKAATSLFKRYRYAQKNGWEDLTRVTEKTIKAKYWFGLYKFLDWAIREKIYLGARPKFECIDPENLASLPRDAFEDEELLQLLSLPLFTGCLNRTHVWKVGSYFVQSSIYWGYLICIFSGMRPGEVGQLECSQIRTDGTFYYFDLREFDARGGRVALQDLRSLKTNAAGRVIPIHPILIELGLLDRMQAMIGRDEKRMFPDWQGYVRKDGTTRWSQPLSKSWQYVKKILKIERADVSLYSTRHFFADLMDNEAIAQRTRDRILGHAGDVSRRYGRKGVLDPRVAGIIESMEPPIIKNARAVLFDAKRRADKGELIVLKA